jgi:3-oxoacyl-[acyl-carrier-protein] synthase-3
MANSPATNGHNVNGTHPINGQHPGGPFRFRQRQPVRYAHIVGWGMKIPDLVIKNSDLEAVVDTTDEWIRSRTGIQERRLVNDRESVVSMGFEAARAAVKRAGLLPTEVDLIVVATSTPEDIYPSTACKIQARLGATRAGAFDLSAACSGFVYAMNMAAQSIRSGSINHAVVIGTEANSRVLDWNDRSTCILFGDGAGAVVMSGSDEPGGWQSCVLGADGSGADLLGIPTVGYPSIPEGKQLHKLHMNGREVFRFATHIIPESVNEALRDAGLALADIALIVPHQANQRILNAAARTLNVPESLFYSNVHKYGNTSAASIPIALCEAEKEGRIKPNDNIIIVGFGGGLTWATAVVQWQTVPKVMPKGVVGRLSQGRQDLIYVFAFWRDRVMRAFRRWEARVKGSPVKTANMRDGKKGDRPAETRAVKKDKTDASKAVEPEQDKEKTR